jgi:hypothetical protein
MAVCCFLFGAAFYNEVNAQGLGSDRSGWSYFSMPDGRTIVSQGGGVIGSIPATPLYTSPPAGAAVVNNGRALAVSGGSVFANASSDLKVGRASLPVTIAAKVPPASIGALIKKALPLVPILATGVALYDLAKELNFDLTKSDTGTIEVKKVGPQTCTSSRPANPTWNNYCVNNGNSSWAPASYTPVIESGTCKLLVVCSNGWNNGTYESWEYVTQISAGLTSSTDLAFADAVANQIGWPDSSAIAKALDQAQRLTNDPIPTEGPKVSGPASVAGRKEVTKNPISNGERETTKQTNYDCQYFDGPTVTDGGTVACAEKTTTTEKDTVTDPQTQQTTVTTKQTAETIAPVDTTSQKPQEPTDPCDKNPDRVGCATLDTPEGEIPKITKTFTFQAEDLGLGGGSCPAPTTVSTSNGSYTLDLGRYCDAITTYVRPVVILFGMLAAFLIKQLLFCKFRELILECCAYAPNQGFMFR